MKYLVYAIYPNLGIHVRVTGYETEEEMLDYVSALRMCDTPYLVQKFKRGYPMMIDLDFAGLTRQEIIDYLNEYVDSLCEIFEMLMKERDYCSYGENKGIEK